MVTTFYPPYNFGGDGIFVYRLVRALAEQGHEVHVVYHPTAFTALGGTPGKDYPTPENVTLHPLPDQGTLDLLLTHQLGRPALQHHYLQTLLAELACDILHFHNISLLGGPGVLAYGGGIKLCTLHDHWFVCAMHVLWRFDQEACSERTCLRCTLAGGRPPQFWRYTQAVAQAAQSVDAFITGSDFARTSHRNNGFPAPIHTLPHFIPDPGEPVASYHHPRPYFLFVGRLEKLKGAHVLLEHFRCWTGADLLIAGTGSYEGELREMASSQVHFLGSQTAAALARLYRGAVATVIPSLCYETFGLVALESFAQKTPVVVHDLGALPEVAQTGGLTYRTPGELGAHLETLVTRPQYRQQLGEAGYQSYRQHYTEAAHLERYFALISTLKEAVGWQQH